jgi:aryl-alcohol dehydrogenase-like predicted oxidoreductase
MTFIDTADAYCIDSSETGYGERLVARALREWGRGEVLVATKGGKVRPGGAWVDDGRPEHLRAACEASLKALGVSSIFLYQLHVPDRRVYFPDSVGALAELQRQGKIRHIGLSNIDAAQIRQASRIVQVVSVQNHCNVLYRHAFASGVVDACERQGIGFVAYAPVGGQDGRARIASDPTLMAVGARNGVSPQQVALAWLLARSPAIIVIPGASRAESARASAAAADLVLGASDRAELDRAFPDASFLVKKLSAARRETRHLVRSLRARARRIVAPS